MGWLSRKIGNWATNTQKGELEGFISHLKTMDGSEIGFVLAMATDRRHALRRMYGWDLLEPQIVEMNDVTAALKLSQLIHALQKSNDTVAAAALMVWLHTVRSANNLDLRGLGREMWAQLARGQPHAVEAAYDFLEIGGSMLNLDGAERFPAGLTPTPL